MAPWIIPLITMAANKKQEGAAREDNARQQIHAIRSRLAGQYGSPGFREGAAGNLYSLDKQIEQQNAARNAQMIAAFLQNNKPEAEQQGIGFRDGEYDPEAASKDVGNFARNLMRGAGYA